ncbi:hypothetical protein QFC19_001776 [Naganishia cerealis]|uniref:Uncharacterized protein n=1 Tax=Naganishia cerealis TaxID=610337 RepID=A0ACC2WFK0_9TREE|nr:hypothetical protein QFC19_001776 [Naganishia cerealis]
MNNSPCSVSTAICKSKQHSLHAHDRRQDSVETTVIAHAQGFTLIENAYWKNHTWYFVSSRTWAFPELKYILTNSPDNNQHPEFHDGLAKLVSPVEAQYLGLYLDEVEVVEGSTLIFNDKTFLDHFYHLVGEMFLGAWRVYTSVLVNPFEQKSTLVKGKSVIDQLPPIERFIFSHANPDKVFDHARLNQFFLGSVFPRAALEFKEEWQARANSLKLFRFDMVTIADRWSGHMDWSPKPMDRAFRLPVPSNWIHDLKQPILRNYKGPVSLKDPSHAKSKPVITYLSRQDAVHRTLTAEAHELLVAGLKALEKEDFAEVNIEEFNDATPKDEQVTKLSRTTIFVALHGNGLTNLIWMSPDALGRSAVYEIQQPGMFSDDYAILSEALGMEHWIIGGRNKELE